MQYQISRRCAVGHTRVAGVSQRHERRCGGRRPRLRQGSDSEIGFSTTDDRQSSSRRISQNQIAKVSCELSFFILPPSVMTINRIHQATMWILGEYCVTVPEIRHFMDEIKKAVGEVRKQAEKFLVILQH